MANIDDFADGTAFIYLFPEDFKSEYRFKQYHISWGKTMTRLSEYRLTAAGQRDTRNIAFMGV